MIGNLQMLFEIGLLKRKKKQTQKQKQKQNKTKAKKKKKNQNCIKSGLFQFLFLQQKM